MEKVVCAHCGELVDVDEITEIDCQQVCNSCRDELYVQCRECGEWLKVEDAEFFEDDYYHSECLDDITFICDSCGRRHFNDDGELVYNRDGSSQTWCYHCRDNYAYYCNNCENYFSYDLYYDEDNDCYYCDICKPKEDKIKHYHAHHGGELYFTSNGLVNLSTFAKYGGLGIELEIEKPYSSFKDRCATAEKCEKILGENRAVFENDGSLTDGFEIITSPHTIKAFKKLDFQTLFEMLLNEGYRSHDGGNCGLHIHFSKSLFGTKYYYLNLAKVIYFYHKYFDKFVEISRRTQNQIDDWANKMWQVSDIISTSETPRKAIEIIIKNLKDNIWCNRYCCINLKNYATVEFRLGRGTLKYDTFKKWIDLHIALVKNSHKVSIDYLDDLDTWLKGVDIGIVDVFKD